MKQFYPQTSRYPIRTLTDKEQKRELKKMLLQHNSADRLSSFRTKIRHFLFELEVVDAADAAAAITHCDCCCINYFSTILNNS